MHVPGLLALVFSLSLTAGVAAQSSTFAEETVAPDNGHDVRFAIGPIGGFQKSQDADEGIWWGGGAIRLHLSPVFGLELSASYRQENYRDTSLNIESVPVMFSVLLYPVPNVYGVAGGSWQYTVYDFDSETPFGFDDDGEGNLFGVHLGGGMQFVMSERLTFAGDARWIFLDYDATDLPGYGDELDSDYLRTAGMLLYTF